MKTTNKTVVEHLRKFADWLEKESDYERTDAANTLNDWLDTLFETDVFGTEGQNDPRGDHRNG